jgi:uncharacterized protein YdgA (DUF945 family)
MRKFLIGLILLAAIVLGIAFWLGGQAEKGKPADGEIRTEIESVF